MPATYSIVIPAYNEANSIAHAINEVDQYFRSLDDHYELIVVDDGSKDLTASIVHNLSSTNANLRLLPLPFNQGKGAAVRAGMLQATGDYLIFLDADLSTHPRTFETFLPHLDDADILIGSRGVTGSDVVRPQPLYRTLAGKLFNQVIRLYLHLPFRDTQCGFKVFHKRTQGLFSAQEITGWAFDVELLMRAKQAGLQILEIPVQWQNAANSKVKLRSFFEILREVIFIKRMTKPSTNGSLLKKR